MLVPPVQKYLHLNLVGTVARPLGAGGPRVPARNAMGTFRSSATSISHFIELAIASR